MEEITCKIDDIKEMLDNLFLAVITSEQYKMGLIPDEMYKKYLVDVAFAFAKNYQDGNKK